MKIEMLENSAGFGKGGTYEVDRELGQRLADKGKARVLGDQSDHPTPFVAAPLESLMTEDGGADDDTVEADTQENAAEDSADITSDE